MLAYVIIYRGNVKVPNIVRNVLHFLLFVCKQSAV